MIYFYQGLDNHFKIYIAVYTTRHINIIIGNDIEIIRFFSVFTIIKIIYYKQLNTEINSINTLKFKISKKEHLAGYNCDLTFFCKLPGRYNRFLLIAHDRKLYTLQGL